MMSPLFSFIIPAYNCQDTIKHCIESITSQCFHDYEIIIIDDHSNDNTANICSKLSESNSQIKLISNHRNLGTSSTRNKGLDYAKGEFVWFVDSDDTIESGILSDFESYITSHPDLEILCFNHIRIFNSETIPFLTYISKSEPISGIDYLSLFYNFYLWNKIYKRSFINEIRFIPGTKNIEDLYFNIQVISSASKIYLYDKIGYHYNCTTLNSTSRNKNKRNLIKLTQDSLCVHNMIHNNLKEIKYKKLHNSISNILRISISGHLFSLIRFYNIKRVLSVINTYKKWGEYPISRTSNRKANIFIFFINQETILKMLSKFML